MPGTVNADLTPSVVIPTGAASPSNMSDIAAAALLGTSAGFAAMFGALYSEWILSLPTTPPAQGPAWWNNGNTPAFVPAPT